MVQRRWHALKTRISHSFLLFLTLSQKTPGVSINDQIHAVDPPCHGKAAWSGSSQQNEVMFLIHSTTCKQLDSTSLESENKMIKPTGKFKPTGSQWQLRWWLLVYLALHILCKASTTSSFCDFFWGGGTQGLHCCARAFSSCSRWHCYPGFSLRWLLLQSTGSRALGHGSWGMWNLPRPGIKPTSPT